MAILVFGAALATVYAIVDAALICHVGFEVEGQPVVIPTLHARQGDRLLLHGATNSRLIRHVQAGHPLCVSVAIADGLVLGKAVCSHSINYRSAVLFGRGCLVEGEEARLRALEALRDALGAVIDARADEAEELARANEAIVPGWSPAAAIARPRTAARRNSVCSSNASAA